MRTFLSTALGIFSLQAVIAIAETQDVSTTNYGVVVESGDIIETPAGTRVAVGELVHLSIVNEGTEEQQSQWCRGESELDGPSAVSGRAAGYCTIIADNGDVLWVSYFSPGNGQPTLWNVMGGTGEYEGATGSGTTQLTSERGDGEAWTSQSTGTLTTK